MTPSLTRILMIEDDPDIQVVARLALETVGRFTLATCSSGQEALETATSFAANLIMLDVMMPGMDGPSTLQALRTMPQVARTPVIFMTAKAQRHEVEYYLALGALGVITKPFDPMELSATITSLWIQHHECVNKSSA